MNNGNKKKIVCFGDSVTEGCFGLYPTSYGFDTYRIPEKAYPTKLSAVLNAESAGFSVINAGVGGETATAGLRRIKNDVLSHNPDIVVVAFGLNDTFRDISSYSESIYEIFSEIKKSGAQPILLTPNMMNTYIHSDVPDCAMKVARSTMEFQTCGKLRDFAAAAKAIASSYGAPVCDVYSYWEDMFKSGTDTTELLANRINHPCEKMHGITAKMLAEIILGI